MLKRMTIGKRIVFGFMSMIAQLVLVAFIGYNGIRETITGMDGIVCHPEVAMGCSRKTGPVYVRV